MKYGHLFSPIKLRELILPNRVIMSAMGSLMIGRDKKVTQQLADYLAERAKGGVGLVYSPCCGVHDPSTPEGFLGIGTDEIGESHSCSPRQCMRPAANAAFSSFRAVSVPLQPRSWYPPICPSLPTVPSPG